MRWIRRTLLILLVAAAVALALGAALPGGEKEVARGSGSVLRLEARPEGLVWLEAAPDRGTTAGPRRILSLPRGAGAPKALAEAPGIADFSLQDAVYYVTGGDSAVPGATANSVGPTGRSAPFGDEAASAGEPSEGRRHGADRKVGPTELADRIAPGALYRVAFEGGAPELLRSGLRRPTAVFAGRDWLCWTESQPGAAVSLSVLPLTCPHTVLRAIPKRGGEVRTLAVSDAATAAGPLRPLGELDGDLYWGEQRTSGRAATLLKRAPLPAAAGAAVPVEALGTEEGIHEGLMAGGAFYWTGGSREGAPAQAYASANRRAPGGRIELLGEWLAPDGVLRADGDRVYYCRNGVYGLPGDAGTPRKIISLHGVGRLTRIVDGNAYTVENEAGRGYRIVRRPLHWSGRWAARRGAVP